MRKPLTALGGSFFGHFVSPRSWLVVQDVTRRGFVGHQQLQVKKHSRLSSSMVRPVTICQFAQNSFSLKTPL